jgi:hypothetical protein
MDETRQLVEALRLAVDPPGGVSVDALRDLVRKEESDSWDIVTMHEHVGVSPHTLSYYERIRVLVVGQEASGHGACSRLAIRTRIDRRAAVRASACGSCHDGTHWISS